MRPPKGDGVPMPTPSTSTALPATAARDLTQWKVYERTSDKIFSRQTINDVDVLKKLVPKEANSKKTSALAQSQATGGGGGGTKSRRRGGEGTEEG